MSDEVDSLYTSLLSVPCYSCLPNFTEIYQQLLKLQQKTVCLLFSDTVYNLNNQNVSFKKLQVYRNQFLQAQIFKK